MVVGLIILSLLFSTMISSFALAESDTYDTGDVAPEVLNYNDKDNAPTIFNGDPQIEINYPKEGYLYLFKLKPIKMPLSSALGLNHAVVIGRSLDIDTSSSDIHHAKFVAKRKFAGWETVRWDYNNINGLSMDLGLSTGIYDITVYAYDEDDNELDSDSIKVSFIKVGRDDFGIWVNTRYDNGETYSTPLDIGLAEFGSMLGNGESKKFSVSMQSEDDTTVEMRFTRTKILGGSENVIETQFNVETECDTSKDYEASLEVRFPFVMLDGGDPSDSNNPYFDIKLGYVSYSENDEGANKVNTTVFFGRESIEEPRVFRMKLKPENVDVDSRLTFFNSYRTIDGSGNEQFYRAFSVEFNPATELTITTIPSEAKISYDFGESAGTLTRISFRAEGGILDDIIQSFRIDPLPNYMSFDLTIIGVREFIYESDSTYDVTYNLYSIQNGNLVAFQVIDLPEHIHVSWGIDLGEVGDLSASSFVEYDSSDNVEKISVSVLSMEDIPFVNIENPPRKFRIDCLVDILEGIGNITILRLNDEIREIDVSLAFEDVSITNNFELKNNFLQFVWDIDLLSSIGSIEIFRDSESTVAFQTSIEINDWTFSQSFELKNNYLQLAWDINQEERRGNIVFSRDYQGGVPSISLSIGHNDWVISNTLEFHNDYIELYWNLPDDENNHAEIGLITSGEDMFYNTLSVSDDSGTLLSFGIGIETSDHFYLSWDNDGEQITNFEWSGRILSISNLDVAVYLPGDTLTIGGSWTVGESGSFSIELNKPVTITFVDIETDRLLINGYISFYADRRLEASWNLEDVGYLTLNTNGESLGEEASFKVLYDPTGQANYKYGFNLTAPDFLETNLNVSWNRDLLIPRILVAGQLPSNWVQWDKWLLWDYEWWEIGL